MLDDDEDLDLFVTDESAPATAPEAVAEFIKATGADALGQIPSSFSTSDYGERADQARRSLQVVKVACSVDE